MERGNVDGHVIQRPETTNYWLENVLFVQTKQDRTDKRDLAAGGVVIDTLKGSADF
jgi:hypothetical protein